MIIEFNGEGRRTGMLARWEKILDAEYAPLRAMLHLAGLSEEQLRQMDPDDRVTVLE